MCERQMKKKRINHDDKKSVQARNVKQNPKAFWRYCRSKIKNRSKLGDLKMADGKLTGDDDETKADLLNSFFASVFTHENTDIPVLEINIRSKIVLT